MKPHISCLPLDEARQLMGIPKSSDATLSWRRANNHNFLITDFVPIDARDLLGGTLAQTVIQLEYKPPKRIKSSEKLLLTLFKLQRGARMRAYQIEASDENKRSSHNEHGDIYGCHEHIGDSVNKLPPHYPVGDLPNWFGLFCGKVNLTFQGTLPDLENYHD